jgi:ferritin-like metal-binding protein YciE
MKQSSTASVRGRTKSAGNSASSRNSGAGNQGSGSRNPNAGNKGQGTRSNTDSSSGTSRTNRASDARGNADSSGRGAAAITNSRHAGSSGAGHFEGESHLEKFFLDQLQDIYYAEQKIVQSLPNMQQAATTGELKEAFEDHLHQTQRHVKRLERVFETLGKKAVGKKCEAIEGIAREVETIIGETEEGTLTRDAALIIAAQKVEHYEIATYGGLVQLAITMQLHDAADLLDKTLVEEEDTDARLTEIAENEINLGAEHEGNQYSWDARGKNSGEQEEEDEEDVDEGPSV